MANTDRHGFILWDAGFTQSDTILNDLLLKLETKIGGSVLDRDLNQPAGGESDGDMYIVGSTPAGDWSAFTAGDVVILRESTWYNFTPRRGATVMVEDESNIIVGWTGSAWTTVSVSQAYVDSAVAGLLDYKGGYNASTNTPDLDSSPSGVLKGDSYTVTADGDFFTEEVHAGDMLIAEIDSAAALADWTIVESNAPKNNDVATTDPGVGDDDADGYSPGSRWTNVTADTVWFCLDASTGAAVWQQVGSGGGGLTPVFKTAAYTASAGELVLCDTSGGAFTITLPASPSDADRVAIADVAGSAATNNITVGRNAETINGDAEDFVIDQNYGQFDASYNTAGTDWKAALSGNPTPATVFGKRRITLRPEGELQSKSTDGASAAWLTLNSTGVPVEVRCFSFANTGTNNEYCQFSWVIPPSCDPAGTFRARLIWAPSNTNTNGTVFNCRSSFGSDLETISASAWKGALSDAPGGTAGNVQFGPWASWTESGLAEGDLHNVQFYRISSDAGDTFTGAMQLVAIEFEYEELAGTDD